MHTVTPHFPVSTTVMIIWALALLAANIGFIISLLRLNRKGHRKGIVAIFVTLLACATAIHVVLLNNSTHTVTDGNWIQLVLVSLVAAIEMFIGHTVVFDDIIAAVIFGEPGFLMAYITIFVLIISFTLSMVLLIMPRRLRDRTWLISNAHNARKNRKNHIFLGLNNHSKAFAQSILQQWEASPDKTAQGEVILVDFPDAQSHHSELSIGELISNIFGQQKERSLESQLGSNRFVLLKGQMPDGAAQGNLCEVIALKRLAPWLENSRTTLYLLSPEEEDNINLVKYIATDPAIKAKILCYSLRVNSYASLLAGMGERIRVLNLPEMSFNEVRQNQPDLHPIHYVDIARNAKGEPLGYVNNAYTSLLIGFEETGQEALRYLYEFGSFVGKDMQSIPNTFKVYDPDIERLKGSFLNRTPALRYGANIEWSDASVGTSRFWLEYAMVLPSLTYTIITVDDGRQNIEIAVKLLQEASRYGKDLSRMCILVGATHADSYMLQLIDFYNRSYCPEGVEVIHPFGLPEKIWNLDVITGRKLKERAMHFISTGPDSLTPQERWRERSRSIRNRGGNQLLNQQELMRKQAGEISRSLFAASLLQLCPERLYGAGADIPDSFDPEHPVHFTGKKADYPVMEYLAAGEHLHWMAAFEVAGYIDADGTTNDELNKKLRNLKPYTELRDEQDRHPSWLGVKQALQSI